MTKLFELYGVLCALLYIPNPTLDKLHCAVWLHEIGASFGNSAPRKKCETVSHCSKLRDNKCHAPVRYYKLASADLLTLEPSARSVSRKSREEEEEKGLAEFPPVIAHRKNVTRTVMRLLADSE